MGYPYETYMLGRRDSWTMHGYAWATHVLPMAAMGHPPTTSDFPMTSP